MKKIYSEDEFKDIMEVMESVERWDANLYDNGIQIKDDSPLYNLICETIRLLENMFEDEECQWISWWMYETDFGKDEKMAKVYTHFGDEEVEQPLPTSKELYQLLIENMEYKKNGRNDTE